MAQLLPAYSGLHGDFCCGCRDSCSEAEVECGDAFWLFSAPFYIPISRRSDEDSRRIDISLPLLLSTLLLYLLPLFSAVLKLYWFIKISTTTTTTATTASTHSTLQFACRLLLFFIISLSSSFLRRHTQSMAASRAPKKWLSFIHPPRGTLRCYCAAGNCSMR